MKKDTVVVDLDGTLCNIDHRKHLVAAPKPDWATFYALAYNDKVNEWCAELIRAVQMTGHKVWLVSARPESMAKMTMDWLIANRIERVGLALVRPDRNYSPDMVLKKKWAVNYGVEKILFAVDDRQRVVDMWRELGITCLQCDAWPERRTA